MLLNFLVVTFREKWALEGIWKIFSFIWSRPPQKHRSFWSSPLDMGPWWDQVWDDVGSHWEWSSVSCGKCLQPSHQTSPAEAQSLAHILQRQETRAVSDRNCLQDKKLTVRRSLFHMSNQDKQTDKSASKVSLQRERVLLPTTKEQAFLEILVTINLVILNGKL